MLKVVLQFGDVEKYIVISFEAFSLKCISKESQFLFFSRNTTQTLT